MILNSLPERKVIFQLKKSKCQTTEVKAIFAWLSSLLRPKEGPERHIFHGFLEDGLSRGFSTFLSVIQFGVKQ